MAVDKRLKGLKELGKHLEKLNELWELVVDVEENLKKVKDADDPDYDECVDIICETDNEINRVLKKLKGAKSDINKLTKKLGEKFGFVAFFKSDILEE